MSEHDEKQSAIDALDEELKQLQVEMDKATEKMLDIEKKIKRNRAEKRSISYESKSVAKYHNDWFVNAP